MARDDDGPKRGETSQTVNSIREILTAADHAYKDGKFDQAITKYREALEISPGEPSCLVNLAVALRAAGRSDEAIECIEEAIERQPDNPDAHYNLGNAHRSAGRLEAAVTCYSRAIELKPDYMFAYSNLALALKDLKKFDEGVACLSNALRLFPDEPKLYANLGVVLWDGGKIDASIASYRRAVALSPDDTSHDAGQVHHNLATALFRTGAYEQAIEHERHAVEMMPSFAESHAIMGQCHSSMGRTGDALECFEHAFRLQPDNLSARLGRARTLLLAGDLKQGFAEYEWRWSRPTAENRRFDQPEWDGTDLAGRRILLYAEQGLGDTIHAARYIPQVAATGGVVVVECPQTLVSLIASVDGADIVLPSGNPLPAFDCQAPLLSLPRIMGTTLDEIPDSIPYLHVENAGEPETPATSPGARHVGIAWGGNPNHENDKNRSCDLRNFLPLTTLPGTRFYSLQVGPRSADIEAHGCGPLFTDLSPRLRDFTDTARIVTRLDLVICVDTAVAHLAGALGTPVWLMLPFAPDWRWMLGRNDSPWYPTMILYRQPEPGDWDSVIVDIRQDLEKFCATPQKRSGN